MSKHIQYEKIAKDYSAIIAGENNQIARYSTLVALLVEEFGARFFWCGFYIVDKPEELVIGPYQGTLGCLRIPFARGVCGAAARTKTTQLVEDVHAFPDHIACDSRSNSEIVVPVFDKNGELRAVLDIDSTEYGAFDLEDQKGLEELCGLIF